MSLHVNRAAGGAPDYELPVGSETYSSAMSDAKNYMGWIIDSFGDTLAAPILEIGVGHGSYAQILKARGRYYGVDISADSVAAARERFPDVEFEVADITTPAFVSLTQSWGIQSIVCLNVLEHIPDHEAAVRGLGAALKPGGHLLVIVPALQLLYNDLDRFAGHCRRYKVSEVRALFDQAGLETVRADYFNFVGGVGWLANRLKRHSSLNDTAVNAQISFFDRWLVPVSRFVDPATRSFFGQSVIAVGRKP